MADYTSSLTGQQMDAALTDMAMHNSEAWAVGRRNGIAVTSGDETYNNNSRYWASRASAFNTSAQDAAARAEAAIPVGTESAVLFDRAQSLTGSQQAQAKTNIDAGGATNPNLLFNPWFLIDQRGQSSYVGPGTGYDMWRMLTGSSIENATNGKKLSLSGGYHFNLMQYLPDAVYTNLLKKTVTVSFMSPAGVVSSVTGTLPASITAGTNYSLGNITFNDVVFSVRFAYSISGGYQRCSIWFYTSQTADFSVYIRAIKLEIGSVSTLANDTAPFYIDELHRCQYYLRVIRGISGSGYAFLARAMSATIAAIYINGYMVATPTATYTGSPTVQGTAISGISSSYRNSETMEVRLTTTGLTSGSLYQVSVPSGASIILSAEPALV